MDDRDDDRVSSSLPETLHAHIIRPNDQYGRSNEASWSAQDRHLVQQASHLTSQSISSLTPATFPNSHGSRGESSQDRLVSPDVEESGYSSQRIQNTSASRRGSAAAGLAHPPRAFLIPHGNRTPGSEPPFYHQVPIHSYTYPPPLPSQYHVPSPSAFQGRAGLSSSSHTACRPGGGSRAPEENRNGDDGDDSEQTHEITPLDPVQEIHLDRYLTSQPRPVPFPPFIPRGSRENSTYLYNAPHSYDDSGHLQPSSHHLESNIIRHHSLPPQRREERSRPGSSSNRHAPGTLLDGRPIQRASSYSLPPITTFMRPLREEYSDRGPQTSSHGLLDQTREDLPAEVSVEDRESSSERPTYRRGKRKRSDTQDERKTKVARKIYVACDFCRGRKLRCDGTKPSCANCSTRTLECIYKDHPRRRGPGKAPKGSRTKKSEGKGRKGRKSSKTATSEIDREGSEQPSAAGLPDRHVFEPPMMLPGHGHPHLSRLVAVYALPPYTDRPSASNMHREEPEPIPHCHFRSDVFDQGPVEGMQPLWRRDEEDSRSAESGHPLPPGSRKGDTDEELTN
ncbi:uncharacterized protein BJ212DRAFT_1477152 [Suillus subaureus]|uniref:Zn(2)-C6 fungal-type domain-containing protein n=1 Tax=Suillus subaureus TaxID=48587 RepID=A0A9P7EJ19_9AGAM|nr:uncharacterized protein BJ212DRAFT_1477152 [Suillus subaureus]KAG1822738.1 hypothetical protein BJ212DRAFT_1477152 [Suillus subaureus]